MGYGTAGSESSSFVGASGSLSFSALGLAGGEVGAVALMAVRGALSVCVLVPFIWKRSDRAFV
jgi:hypothetical protein